jgi:hypothetical protein
MRKIRTAMGVLLLSALAVAGTEAQSAKRSLSGVQALAVAEHALIDALMRHDRAAFQKLLTPDSAFFFPRMSEGPEAIVEAWTPFLSEGGPTLEIISDGVTVSSATRGSSTGSFAIRGEADEDLRSISAGRLSITWRRVNGGWKVSALDGAGEGGVRLTPVGGVGNFRFGMSREQVLRVPDCKPYSNVPSTGGLECPFYRFEGRPLNTSFLFNAGGLYRVQLSFYEGGSDIEARDAVSHVVDYLRRTTGDVRIDAPGEVEVTADAIMAMLKDPVPAGRVTRVDLSGRSGESASEAWSARVERHQIGYSVLLFANRR